MGPTAKVYHDKLLPRYGLATNSKAEGPTELGHELQIHHTLDGVSVVNSEQFTKGGYMRCIRKLCWEVRLLGRVPNRLMQSITIQKRSP